MFFALAFTAITYIVMISNIDDMKNEAALAGDHPPIELVIMAGANFLIRIACILIIPFAALRASAKTILSSLVCLILTAWAAVIGAPWQACYFGAIAVIAFVLSWKNLPGKPDVQQYHI
jgi:hypothetical protein